MAQDSESEGSSSSSPTELPGNLPQHSQAETEQDSGENETAQASPAEAEPRFVEGSEAEAIVEEEILVGKWDCHNCDRLGNSGDSYDCSGCGAPRPEDVQFYLGESPRILSDKADIEKAEAGRDWYCRFCDSGNSNIDHSCSNCGADKGSAKHHVIKDPEDTKGPPQPQQDPTLDQWAKDKENGLVCSLCLPKEKPTNDCEPCAALRATLANPSVSTPSSPNDPKQEISSPISPLTLAITLALLPTLFLLFSWFFSETEAELKQIYWTTQINEYSVSWETESTTRVPDNPQNIVSKTKFIPGFRDEVSFKDEVLKTPYKVKVGTKKGVVGHKQVQRGTKKGIVDYKKVRDGNKEVVSHYKQVQNGTKEVKAGTKRVQDGTKRVVDRYQLVKVGSKKVLTGYDRIRDGTRKVKTGTRKVRSGTKKVQSGTKKVKTGTKKVKSGTEKVLSHYKTSTEIINLGNGKFKKVVKKVPVYTYEDTYKTVDVFKTVPIYKTVPDYRDEAIYETQTVYKKVARYKDVPQYDKKAVYKEVPNYIEKDIYKTVPAFKKVAVYKTVPNYRDEPIYGQVPNYIQEPVIGDVPVFETRFKVTKTRKRMVTRVPVYKTRYRVRVKRLSYLRSFQLKLVGSDAKAPENTEFREYKHGPTYYFAEYTVGEGKDRYSIIRPFEYLDELKSKTKNYRLIVVEAPKRGIKAKTKFVLKDE